MKFLHVYIIHSLFETVQLEISAFLCFAYIFICVATLFIYRDLVGLSQPHSQPLRDLKCKSGLRSTNKCRPIELIGRCLLGGTSGFYDAYPKRAQKLLVGRSQTLLICYFYMFICGASPLRVCYVFVLFL